CVPIRLKWSTTYDTGSVCGPRSGRWPEPLSQVEITSHRPSSGALNSSRPLSTVSVTSGTDAAPSAYGGATGPWPRGQATWTVNSRRVVTSAAGGTTGSGTAPRKTPPSTTATP